MFPSGVILRRQTHIRLVNEGRWLQRMVSALASAICSCQPPELTVGEPQRIVARVVITFSPLLQETTQGGVFVGVSSHDPIAVS